jgi:hypothetical protein
MWIANMAGDRLLRPSRPGTASFALCPIMLSFGFQFSYAIIPDEELLKRLEKPNRGIFIMVICHDTDLVDSWAAHGIMLLRDPHQHI